MSLFALGGIEVPLFEKSSKYVEGAFSKNLDNLKESASARGPLGGDPPNWEREGANHCLCPNVQSSVVRFKVLCLWPRLRPVVTKCTDLCQNFDPLDKSFVDNFARADVKS